MSLTNKIHPRTAALLRAGAGAAVIFSTSGLAYADDVELKSLSPALQQAINEQAAGAEIREIERETENGLTFYEVDIVKDGRRMEFKIGDSGKLLAPPMTARQRAEQKLRDTAALLKGNDVKMEQLPAEVQAAVKKETAGGTITEMEMEKENGITFYEVEYEKDGSDHEITLDPTGKIVKRDD